MNAACRGLSVPSGPARPSTGCALARSANHCRRGAGRRGLHEDGAGVAHAAGFLCAGQDKTLAQEVDQQMVRLDRHLLRSTLDLVAQRVVLMTIRTVSPFTARSTPTQPAARMARRLRHWGDPMSQEQQGPLTEGELSSLAQKLKELGKDLSPKEKWFLNETLQSGIAFNQAGEMQGYTMQSA